MYYELYIDQLFLVNFVMNLYVLMQVNHTAKCTATRLRLIISASIGAIIYCLSFFIPLVPAWSKLVIGTGAVSVIMIAISFRPIGIKAYVKLIESLIGYSFLLGSVFLFLINRFEAWRNLIVSVWGIMGIGGLFFMGISYKRERSKKRKSEFCKVTLIRNATRITVIALIDTGNGLIEPISGRPVSITSQKIVDDLWQDELPIGFRAIPYHSVGCNKGIMKGYEVPEMIVEVEGVPLLFRNVYLGISEEAVASSESYGIILNPKLLEGEKKYDTKSGNAGKCTV